MVKGFSKSANTPFHFTKPSPDTYPFQFFWDTCFHAFILCSLGKGDMAKSYLQSLFALQDADGFVGHIIYWNRILPGRSTDIFQSKPGLKHELLMSHMSALLQPPIIAQAVARVYEVTDDLDFLTGFLPKLKRYYTYIATHRDFDGDGLITIISPFESGMDWKASFDEVLGFSGKANWKLFLKAVSVDFRNFYHGYNLDKIKEQDYFHVKEVGFNTVYIQNLYELAKLCRKVNDLDEEYFIKLADRATQSLKDIMYDEEAVAFFDVYGSDNKKLKVFTPTVFFPVVIESIDQEIAHKLIKKHFIDADGFAVKYPIPSLATHDKAFNPNESLYLWRGPTWIYFNWFLYKCIGKYGYKEQSKNLIDTIITLIDKSGFREYYNPFTGEGMGAQNFTWSGLVVDMLRESAQHEG